ncbi:MAG TPA: AarF/ABC1/UbiB kinase family protein [Candidatus Saccharimonadales bacterium]|nr:AarF/ABC1/UbiB kinase family protein [Candidatus Saccharimonadales bacterium]
MAERREPTIAALKRQRARRLARLGAKVYYLRRRGREQEMYDLVCDEFLGLGGVYIKFLQGVLFSTAVMRRWHSPKRLTIFENLACQELDVISMLRTELPPESLKHIALIQPKPFAAGSFGQVYLGEHADGTRIIIKVLRPMIRELLKFDLRLLSMFSKRFAAAEFENVEVRMDQAMKDFKNATLSETDYVTEARFAQDIYHAYRGHAEMVIPKTYLELCTPHLIVQEYIGGVSGAELLQKYEQGVDPVAYVREQTGSNLDDQLTTLGVESLNGAFALPRIMGDPHPGNVRFLPENKVGLIDFGISARAPGNRAAFFGILFEWSRLYQERADVAALFEQFVRFFVNDLYRALKKLSTLLPAPAAGSKRKASGGDMMHEVAGMVQKMFDSALGTSDIRTIMNEGRLLQAFGHMVNRGNRFGLVVRMDSSEILRAAQTYIALVEALGRRGPVMPRLLQETVSRVSREHFDVIHQTDQALSASQAVHIVNRWLERIAARDRRNEWGCSTCLKSYFCSSNIRTPLASSPLFGWPALF